MRRGDQEVYEVLREMMEMTPGLAQALKSSTGAFRERMAQSALDKMATLQRRIESIEQRADEMQAIIDDPHSHESVLCSQCRAPCTEDDILETATYRQSARAQRKPPRPVPTKPTRALSHEPYAMDPRWWMPKFGTAIVGLCMSIIIGALMSRWF